MTAVEMLELQNRGMKEKYALKLKLEEETHKNIMIEIEAAAKGKVSHRLRNRD